MYVYLCIQVIEEFNAATLIELANGDISTTPIATSEEDTLKGIDKC
jgi:hypothetical protein